MKAKISKFPFFVLSLIILLCTLAILLSVSATKTALWSKRPDYPEVAQLAKTQLDFEELKQFFSDVATKKGAVYAFEVLKQAPLPPNTDLHLLGHVVGDLFYAQKGAEGMKYCTQDFRNACSHAIVVGLFMAKGDAALPEIMKACDEAPGGSGAYTMCYHGLGHGILAYTGYDFPKAIELCKKTGTAKRNYHEYAECVGGMVMEQISGGDHDKVTWEKQRLVNLKTTDPLYPCNSDLIDSRDAKTFCYIYITPHLFDVAGMVISGKPSDDAISRAFTFCDQVPVSETRFKDACFGGFGKEFTVLAKDRDIRKIDYMTDEEYSRVFNWCALTPDEPGNLSCIKYAMNSIYWGGENNRVGAIHFCFLAPTENAKNACFMDLIDSVNLYIKDTRYRNDFCHEIPAVLQKQCQTRLSSK